LATFATEVTKISASVLTFVLWLSLAVCFVIAANIWVYAISETVNRRLPKNAQISVHWGPRKMYEVLRLHAEMYPDSPIQSSGARLRASGL
jgi:hypothetical protein